MIFALDTIIELFSVNQLSGVYQPSSDSWILSGPLQDGMIQTNWSSSLTFFPEGAGTVTNEKYFWRRVGDSLEVTGTFTSGTIDGSDAGVTLPFGYNIDYTKISNSNGTAVGSLLAGGTSANIYSNIVQPLLFADGTTTSKVYVSFASNVSTGYVKVSGTSSMTSNASCGFYFKVPIIQYSVGDDAGVQFSMTSAGQLQYTSSNLSGTTVESIMKFIVTDL
jgi:hypothetical protein